MYGIDASISERHLASFDGTPITYYVTGDGDELLILAPGLGTPFISWKYIIEELGDLYTIVTWDPRGTYRSGTPDDLDALRLEDHVRDMVAICEREGYERFVLGGWSMGVEIALEYSHQFPDPVRALVLINGTYEHVLAGAFAFPGAELAVKGLLKLGQRLGPVVTPLASLLLGLDTTLGVMEKTRLVSDNIEFFSHVVKAFSTLDFGVYFKMMLLLNEHSAAAYLGEIDVPTLITAGTADLMTPVTTAERLHEGIRGSELFVIPNGTHYTLAEYPEILNLRLERFLRELDPALFARRDDAQRGAHAGARR